MFLRLTAIFFISTPLAFGNNHFSCSAIPRNSGNENTVKIRINDDRKRQYVYEIGFPEGYERIPIPKNSFSMYVRDLSLKPAGSPVRSYNGSIVHSGDEVVAVIDWDLPSEVQQCADVAIKLHAEYLRGADRINEIKYKSLSGVEISYSKWLKGIYSLNSSQQIIFKPSSPSKADNDKEFNDYLQFVMNYANSSSLARDLPEIDTSEIMPGDLYIQPDKSGRGGIGHLSIVLDICENGSGERLYLFGYGYIPAQDFHLPKPDESNSNGSWFTLDGFKNHIKHFGEGRFHRFET